MVFVSNLKKSLGLQWGVWEVGQTKISYKEAGKYISQEQVIKMLVGPHKGFTLLINGNIFYICYTNYKSNIYLDERFILCIYDCNTFYIPYKKYKSHRTLYKVFTLRIYDYDTFYISYNNYDTFYIPYKMYKSHRTL